MIQQLNFPIQPWVKNIRYLQSSRRDSPAGIVGSFNYARIGIPDWGIRLIYRIPSHGSRQGFIGMRGKNVADLSSFRGYLKFLENIVAWTHEV